MIVLYSFSRCGVGCVLMMGIGVVCMRWICSILDKVLCSNAEYNVK